MTQPLEALTNWHFVYVAFFVTFLGEAGLPLPLVLSGVHLFTGYLVSEGNYLLAGAVFVVSILGSLSAALLIYAFAHRLGHAFTDGLGRWLRLDEANSGRGARYAEALRQGQNPTYPSRLS